jgi:hypothetical protein
MRTLMDTQASFRVSEVPQKKLKAIGAVMVFHVMLERQHGWLLLLSEWSN